MGLFADLVIGRTTAELTLDNKEKIALFSSLPVSRIFGANDVDHLLSVVTLLEN